MKKPFCCLTAIAGLSMACHAQTGDYRYIGSEATITLNPGYYDITAYGAKGGSFEPNYDNIPGGLGAEMSGEFYFAAPATLTLLVGGAGGTGFYFGGGGGGGSFIENGTAPLVVAGGGGGGFYDSTLTYSGVGQAGLTTKSGGTFGVGAGVAGAGGTGGGGTTYVYGGGGGGGGFYGNGANAIGTGGGGGGVSFLSGGEGGYSGVLLGGGGGYGGGYGGGGGGGGGYVGSGGGGGYSGGSGGGGGGGSIIDSSAVAILNEVSGMASPNGSPNGEIIITAVPEPSAIAWGGLGGLLSLVAFLRRK